MTPEEKSTKKKVIPMKDIKDPIRKLAVVWGEAYNWPMWNKHKLASDIQNLFEEMKKEEDDNRKK